MLKENLRLIFKNKMTWLILLLVVAIIVSFSLSKVFNEYRAFEKAIYDSRIVIKKPYAIDVFSQNEDVFAGVLILTVPIGLAFFVFKSDSYDNTCMIRGCILKQKIYRIIAISLVTGLFFFIAYFMGLLTFYLTLNPNMNVVAYDQHFNNVNIDYYIGRYTSDNLMLKSLFWMNKGNSTFFYFLIWDFLYSLLMITFMFLICSFTMCFSNHAQVIVFIISYYVISFGFSYFYDNIFDLIIQMPTLLYEHNEYNNMFLKSWLLHPVINTSLAILLIGIDSGIKRIFRKINNV